MHAALRGRLEDRSPAGMEKRRRFVEDGIAALAKQAMAPGGNAGGSQPANEPGPWRNS